MAAPPPDMFGQQVTVVQISICLTLPNYNADVVTGVFPEIRRSGETGTRLPAPPGESWSGGSTTAVPGHADGVEQAQPPPSLVTYLSGLNIFPWGGKAEASLLG